MRSAQSWSADPWLEAITYRFGSEFPSVAAVKGMGGGMKHGEIDTPLPHSTERGTHKLPRVAPPPVSRVGCDGSDTPHRHRPAVHEDFERQDPRRRPNLTVRLHDVHLLRVQAWVLLRVVKLLPTLHAPIQSAGGQPRHRSPVLLAITAQHHAPPLISPTPGFYPVPAAPFSSRSATQPHHAA